jgi:hypothetical protein
VRLHLDVSGTTYDWTGEVPYVPRVDFRATASQSFDPWAWDAVNATGSTMRQLIADVPLTSGLIPIPGISGGVSFSAQADLYTVYHSTQIVFGGAIDPIDAMTDHVQAGFSAGSSASFDPRLAGHVDWTSHLEIYPALYVEIAGHRTDLSLFSIPVDLGPFGQDWQFNASHAVLGLPDVAVREIVVDFGEVTVGASARSGAPFESDGTMPLVVSPPAGTAAPFSWPSASATIAPRTTVTMPVDFMPTAVGAAEQHVVFHTNDPDTPTMMVTLRGTGVAGPAHDASVAHDASDGGIAAGAHGGCGCTIPHRSAARGEIGLLGLVAAIATRRKRRP